MWTRLGFSSPSSLGFPAVLFNLSAFSPPPGEAIQQAVLLPWHRPAGAVGVCLPPGVLHRLLLGGAITPSSVLPFRLMGDLINVAFHSHGNPTILRAQLGNITAISVPFPSMNMFLTFLAYSPKATI